LFILNSPLSCVGWRRIGPEATLVDLEKLLCDILTANQTSLTRVEVEEASTHIVVATEKDKDDARPRRQERQAFFRKRIGV
jgi:hypothetical protein